MKHYYYLLMACFCMAISACSKDSNSSSPAAKTKTDYLTQKSWIATGQRSNTDNGAWTDTYASVPSCQRDNLLIFASNGTVVNDNGATKCSTSEPQTSSGTWSFTNGETMISISSSGGTGSYTVQQLDDNTLVMVQEAIVSGHSYKSEGTYKHP